jgi:hypothetical protein
MVYLLSSNENSLNSKEEIVTSKKVELLVNHLPIIINDFAQQFIERVITGILSVLKGYREELNIKLSIDGEFVDITIGNDTIQLNPFVNNFIKNTVIGMISSLKNIEQIDRLEINIS